MRELPLVIGAHLFMLGLAAVYLLEQLGMATAFFLGLTITLIYDDIVAFNMGWAPFELMEEVGRCRYRHSDA